MNTAPEAASPSIRYLKGVGPKRALALEKLGVHSLRELFYLFPRRYEDRSNLRTIAQLTVGEYATCRGEVLSAKLKRMRRMTLMEVVVGDDTGMIHAVWFNQPYLKDQFQPNQQVILYGKVDRYQDRLQITSPEYEILEPEEESVHAGRITPIYPLTEGLFQKSLRSTMRDQIQNQLDSALREYLPSEFRDQLGLPGLRDSIRQIHFPENFDSLNDARRRIVFDEFLIFEMMLLRKLEKMKAKHRAHALTGTQELARTFTAGLPFALTPSQKTVIAELSAELGQNIPMNRLLHGDVGAGKTVVAAYALLCAAKSGQQAALLVPTEILAEQHYRTMAQFLEPHGITIHLLTAATPAPKREKLIAELKQGKVQILVGTHALLSEDVAFKSLALLVVDEQHKFGVSQRARLLNKEPRPHQLVMTATPIPRTLALTVYADLSVSTLRELPAGRQPVKTYWIARKKQPEVLDRIAKKITAGEQAYFIFPLIEETEKSDMLAAKKAYEQLKAGVFSKFKVGLVHGRLKADSREPIMQGFRRGEIHILIATSVIEVGVDNPNATVMVIENAERFGLSQLHQMRGRIGRGSKASECFLFGEPKTEIGQKRLRLMTQTQDGFVIAQEDLKLRGPGDFWGTRQSGEPLFRMADPVQDESLLLDARKAAVDLIKNRKLEIDPQWSEFKKYLEETPIKY